MNHATELAEMKTGLDRMSDRGLRKAHGIDEYATAHGRYKQNKL
jgi:hypothetical protein